MEAGDGGMGEFKVVDCGQTTKGPVGFRLQVFQVVDDLPVLQHFQGVVVFGGGGA